MECWRGATPSFALRRWYIHMLGCPVDVFGRWTWGDFGWLFLKCFYSPKHGIWFRNDEDEVQEKDWKITYCSIEGLCADMRVLGGSQRCFFLSRYFGKRGVIPFGSIWLVHFSIAWLIVGWWWSVLRQQNIDNVPTLYWYGVSAEFFGANTT